MSDTLLLLAQQSVPRLDSMYWIMLASRILHILGAIILVGGLFYLRAVVTSVPLPYREGPGEGSFTPADQLFGGRRAVWAMWTGIAALLLLVTGLWNFIYTVKQNELHWSYHVLGTVKIALGLALMILAALLAGRSAAAESIRAKLRFWLSVALLLGILLVMVGSVMRSFPRTLKIEAPNGPQLIAPANAPAN
jgi:hypothetical protein